VGSSKLCHNHLIVKTQTTKHISNQIRVGYRFLDRSEFISQTLGLSKVFRDGFGTFDNREEVKFELGRIGKGLL